MSRPSMAHDDKILCVVFILIGILILWRLADYYVTHKELMIICDAMRTPVGSTSSVRGF